MKNPLIARFSALILVVFLFACSDNKDASKSAAVPTPADESVSAATTSVSSVTHPTEQKLYDLASIWVNKIAAAVAEPDDEKAIAMLSAVNDEMAPQAAALKPELVSWKKSVSEEEAKVIGNRMMQQPSSEKALQMIEDPKLLQRLTDNPQFREAFEKANEGPSGIWEMGNEDDQ